MEPSYLTSWSQVQLAERGDLQRPYRSCRGSDSTPIGGYFRTCKQQSYFKTIQTLERGGNAWIADMHPTSDCQCEFPGWSRSLVEKTLRLQLKRNEIWVASNKDVDASSWRSGCRADCIQSCRTKRSLGCRPQGPSGGALGSLGSGIAAKSALAFRSMQVLARVFRQTLLFPSSSTPRAIQLRTYLEQSIICKTFDRLETKVHFFSCSSLRSLRVNGSLFRRQ